MLLRETQNIVGCNAIDNFGRGQRSRTTISQVSASTPVLIRRLVTAITGYFWEGSIKLSSWATPNNAESEFSEIKFNVFENTRRAPAKQRRLAFCAAKLKALGVFLQTPGNLPHILCEGTTCSFFPSGWAWSRALTSKLEALYTVTPCSRAYFTVYAVPPVFLVQ